MGMSQDRIRDRITQALSDDPEAYSLWTSAIRDADRYRALRDACAYSFSDFASYDTPWCVSVSRGDGFPIICPVSGDVLDSQVDAMIGFVNGAAVDD